MAVINSAQAAAELATLNRKTILRTAPNYKELGTIKIFNVGPRSHTVPMGGLGTFTIPACPEGEAHSEALEIWKLFPEGYHLDMNKMAEVTIDGHELAKSIIGAGKFQHRTSDLRREGVFIAAGDKPTRSELETARATLRETQLLMVEQANNFYQEGPNSHINITRDHRLAAMATGNASLPWVRGAVQMTKCPMCATSVDPEAAICVACKHALRPEIVIANKLPGYEHLWKKEEKPSDEKRR